jgi:hypothetical protein
MPFALSQGRGCILGLAVRKGLYLREDQDRLLKERARKLGVSEAQLVRIALDRFLSGEEGEATAKARASLEAFLAEARHLAGTHRFPEGWRLNREALYAEEGCGRG